MISREFNLYLHAGHSIPLVINVNQYDHGEQWLFSLFNSDGTQYVPSSGAIVGIKSDNLGIINSGSVDAQGRVVINETQQMTAAVGKAVFELVIDDGTHGTANFIVLVEPKPGDNADLSETDISMIEQAIEAASTIKPYGSPLVASTVAGMTDHEKVYVYVGSETGYTSGNWYYWDGSAWTSGGVYNSVAVQTDTTLALSGVAADAKKTGDEISDLKSQISDIEEQIEGGTGSGLTSEIKSALMGIAEHILMWSDGNGPTYISALRNALYPPVVYTNITLDKSSLSFGSLNTTQQLIATTTPTGGEVTWSSSNDSVATVSSTGLVTSVGYGNATITASCGSLTATCSVAVAQATVTSISASYTQGTVYETTPLDDLKSDLVVTASWSNGTTSTVASSDYTLSGTLAEGTSTITASYGGQTATFNVTVSAAYEFFDYVYPVKSGNENYVDTGLIHNSSWATLNIEFKASNTNTNAGSTEGLIGANNLTSSDPSNIIWYGRAKRGGFSTYSLGVAVKVDTVPADEVTVIKYFFVDGGESYIMYGDTRIPVATLSASSITPNNRSLLLAGCYALSENNYKYGLSTTKGTKLGYVKFSDPSSNEVLYNFVPAHNLTTDKYGYYETVNGIFYPAHNDGLGCGNWE